MICGFRQGQSGGPCLVMIDDAVLPMPTLDPKTEARHSPTGFQWGYQGSGPAELARAILVALYPADLVVREPRCYQRFKRDVIAAIQTEEFRLSSAAVDAWLAGWKREHLDVEATP